LKVGIFADKVHQFIGLLCEPQYKSSLARDNIMLSALIYRPSFLPSGCLSVTYGWISQRKAKLSLG